MVGFLTGNGAVSGCTGCHAPAFPSSISKYYEPLQQATKRGILSDGNGRVSECVGGFLRGMVMVG